MNVFELPACISPLSLGEGLGVRGMNFSCPLSWIGRMFSFRNEAFSLGFGFVAHSQCGLLLQ